MKIKALAPWFGAKRVLAPQIVEQLGPHRCYWEPFCGSMAVLLAKEPATYESVNDLHGDLINLALVLQDRGKAEDLYGRAHRTLFHEGLCRLSKDRIGGEAPGGGDVERAYWYLVFGWFHLSGLAGTKLNRTGSFCVRYSAKGGNGATRWRGVVESIPDWHERLLRVQITRRDGLGLIEGIEDEDGTAVYCDPPYFEEGGRYVHEFAAGDHQRLAGLLARFRKARVVLSYYDHPALAELYPGWTVLDWSHLRAVKSMVNSGMRGQEGRTVAPEVLLINGPVIAAEGTLFPEGGDGV